jgi:hypothetical protein
MLEKNIRKLIYNLIKEDFSHPQLGDYLYRGLDTVYGRGGFDKGKKSSNKEEKSYNLKTITTPNEKKEFYEKYNIVNVNNIKDSNIKNLFTDLKKSVGDGKPFYIPEINLNFSSLKDDVKKQYTGVFLSLGKSDGIKKEKKLASFFKNLTDSLDK